MLGRWEQQRGNHELVLISDAGEVTKRRALETWTLKAGSPIQWNPVTNQVLMTLTRAKQTHARAGLIDGDSLKLIKVINTPISEAQWLNAG